MIEPNESMKRPAGRSVQRVSSSLEVVGARFPSASKTRTVSVAGTPAVRASVSGRAEM